MIYMTETLNLISQIRGIDFANELVATGVIKETENGIKYLKINEPST